MTYISKKYLSGPRSTKAVYGIILITAALIGFQLHVENSLEIAQKTFLAAIVIVVAEIYSELLGEKIRRKRNLTRPERQEIVRDTLVISSVAMYPVVVFVLSWAGLFAVETAFIISYALSILGLAGFGYVASQSAGDAKAQSIRNALLAAAIGAAVIVVKYHFSH